MIERKDNGQVVIKFGQGDILFDCATGDDSAIICFDQTEANEDDVDTVKRQPYSSCVKDIENWDVVIEVPNTENGKKFVIDMALYLMNLAFAMKNGKYLWEAFD